MFQRNASKFRATLLFLLVNVIRGKSKVALNEKKTLDSDRADFAVHKPLFLKSVYNVHKFILLGLKWQMSF